MGGPLNGPGQVDEALALLEPAAAACRGDDRVALSVAISLKRIADQLERLDEVVDWNRDQPFGAAVRTQSGNSRG